MRQGRLVVPVVGLGMVFSVVGSVPAVAASKKRPDLVVSSLAVKPAKVAAGGVVKVRDTTRNKGRKKARTSVTRYVLSTNKKVDKRDIRLANRPVRQLKPRKSHATKWRNVRIPATVKPGRYWLIACADATKKVRESNERNNCRVAKGRMTVRKAAFSWPKHGAVKVNVSARVDVAWRYHSQTDTTGFKTVETEDVRLDGKGSGVLYVKNGKPQFLQWHWSKANASGTEVYDAEGQTTSDCPWQARARISGSSPINVRPGGAPTGGIVTFPDDPSGPKASFGLAHKIKSTVTPRINCRGENIGNVSPIPTLELRESWWAKKSTYTINWSRDFSKVTWREYVDNDYQSPNGDSFENKSYQADGVLSVTPAR